MAPSIETTHLVDSAIPLDLALSDKDFAELAHIVEVHIGIKMPPSKKPMVASRLLRRLHQLTLSSYREYCKYIRTPVGWQTEERHFADLVTTHKTEFFRESKHISYLAQRALPQLIGSARGQQTLSVWSAACSTGEEVYTLAMVLEDYRLRATQTRFDFIVLGTDISEFCLETARHAVYSEGSANDIPVHLRSQFLLRGTGGHENLIRITPELRAHTQFRQLNFMVEPWSIRGQFEVIFCRNVLIYFDAERQHRIISGLCDHLKEDGMLFLGHAETANLAMLPLMALGHTVYQKIKPTHNTVQRSDP